MVCGQLRQNQFGLSSCRLPGKPGGPTLCTRHLVLALWRILSFAKLKQRKVEEQNRLLEFKVAERTRGWQKKQGYSNAVV